MEIMRLPTGYLTPPPLQNYMHKASDPSSITVHHKEHEASDYRNITVH